MRGAPVVSIELLLDEATERAVRAEWAALAAAGLSSLGRHPSPSNRPHVTLLVRERVPVAALGGSGSGAGPEGRATVPDGSGSPAGPEGRATVPDGSGSPAAQGTDAVRPSPLTGRISFALTLGGPLLFGAGDRRVLARSVVPSAELLALHADVHAAAGSGEDAAHTAPGSWTPHVTLARRVKVADLAVALPLIGGELAGRASALRRWDAASATVTHLGAFSASA
ncbi:2'-5' RNA ligase family protein [Microbacterium sp. 179-B 1A2 NHS]|uniref:2'-5' RNA ligase family protein n=1 Tax=Microbacterium sp. 179-B 1A2 NHS TaxID=3142383 RepID=UPI00399EF7D7